MKNIRAANYFHKEPPLTDLYINSCGGYTETENTMKTRRIKGRTDYQLIGVVNGTIKVELNGKTVHADKGKTVIFKPGEPQIYEMTGENGAFYWIHFDGNKVKEILKECGLYDGCVFDTPGTAGDFEIISEMISEISRKPKCYQLRLQALFMQLLTSISRRSADNLNQRRSFEKVRLAISAMEKDGEPNRKVKEYADMCLMSEYYFMHTFKEATGMTPMHYKNMIVMERVKSLLNNTDMSLKEISKKCCLSDSLYLSKKFKQAFGCTPTEYRKRGMLNDDYNKEYNKEYNEEYNKDYNK